MTRFQKYLRLLGLSDFRGSDLIGDDVAVERVFQLYMATVKAQIDGFWKDVECQSFKVLVGLMGLQCRSFVNGIAYVRFKGSTSTDNVRVEVTDANNITQAACECFYAAHYHYITGILTLTTIR
jgi:hypothetical protein